VRLLPIDKNVLNGDRLVVFPTNAASLRQTPSTSGQTAQVNADVDFTSSNNTSMVDVELTQPTGFVIQSP
ncbi:MSHA biogenesis protein MshO, partial [Vibrio anguillarum]|nr:MSHA biogenesis protein MshO [Vibrio anguillarum]